MVDLNAAWLEILVGVVSGIVVAVISWAAPKLFGRWSRRKQKPDTSPTKGPDDHGINIGSVGRDSYAQTIDERQFHNYSIEQHINEDRNKSAKGRSDASSDDTWGIIAVAVIVFVLSTLAFVLYTPLFWAVTIGASLGLILVTIRASFKTRKILIEWPRAATLAVASAVIAVLGAIATWIMIQVATVDGLSFQGIQAAVMSPMQGKEMGLVERLGSAFSTISNTYGFSGWRFLLFQLAAAVFAVETLVIVIIHMMGWNTYLRFAHNSTRSNKAIERAAKFTEKGWGVIGIAIFGSAIAVFSASGIPFDLLESQNALSSVTGG